MYSENISSYCHYHCNYRLCLLFRDLCLNLYEPVCVQARNTELALTCWLLAEPAAGDSRPHSVQNASRQHNSSAGMSASECVTRRSQISVNNVTGVYRSFSLTPISELQSVTWHMVSVLHNVTCHWTQVNMPHLNPGQAGTWFNYSGGIKAKGWVHLDVPSVVTLICHSTHIHTYH